MDKLISYGLFPDKLKMTRKIDDKGFAQFIDCECVLVLHSERKRNH